MDAREIKLCDGSAAPTLMFAPRAPAPTPSHTPKQPPYYGLSADDTELTLREGDTIYRIEKIDDGWSTGQNAEGYVGMYVRVRRYRSGRVESCDGASRATRAQSVRPSIFATWRR